MHRPTKKASNARRRRMMTIRPPAFDDSSGVLATTTTTRTATTTTTTTTRMVCRCRYLLVVVFLLLSTVTTTTTTTAFAWTTTTTTTTATNALRPLSSAGRRASSSSSSSTSSSARSATTRTGVTATQRQRSRWQQQQQARDGGGTNNNNNQASPPFPPSRSFPPSRRRSCAAPLFLQQQGHSSSSSSETTKTASDEVNFSEPEVAQVEQFLQTLDDAAENQDNGDDKDSASSNNIDDGVDDDELILQMLPQLPAGVLLKLRQATADHSNPAVARAAARVNGVLRRRSSETTMTPDEIDFSEPEVAQVEQFLQTLDAVAAAVANQDNDDGEDSASSNNVDGDDDDELILQMLPQLPAGVLLKLRQATADHSNPAVARAAARVNAALQHRWEVARQTLRELLEAGELRKLDALIGRAARENRLDAAFFNVLTANLEDAAAVRDGAAGKESETATTTTTTTTKEAANDDNNGATTTTDDDDTETPPSPAASRLQILRHVYTRCQEEVEKTIPAGTALLNKLLRTEQPAIRANLYQHYLAPPPSARTITTPDGKTVELKNDGETEQSSLVPLADFMDAIQQAVLQIRQVEAAGGVDRASAAGMVESLRGVCKEARFAVGQAYGGDSAELREFEGGLQPVFRPTAPDSPYIAAGSGTVVDGDGTNNASAAATSGGGGAGTTNKSPDDEKDRDDDAVEQ